MATKRVKGTARPKPYLTPEKKLAIKARNMKRGSASAGKGRKGGNPRGH